MEKNEIYLQFGLSKEIFFKLQNFLAQFPEIKSVKIIGSRATGTYYTGSDIDLVLFGDCENILSRVQSQIDDLPTPYKYDILNYSTIENKNLISHIDNKGILFYQKRA